MNSKNSPYYIVSPPYTRLSAGIRSLHLLCHNLNKAGERAYILPYGDESYLYRNDIIEPDFLSPIITQHIARRHFEEKLSPIIVYPEIVSGNPYDATCVVRYVLNYPGLLGGEAVYSDEELVFSYSKELASHTKYSDNVLYIPVSDTNIFYPLQNNTTRKGACFYASKYKNEHGGKLFDITQGAFEITSGLPDSLNPYQIADLFRQSEVFYAYENTALITEAALCGCPAVLLPNDYLQGVIAIEEIGTDGIAWGTNQEDIERARSTVDRFYANFLKQEKIFNESLKEFITKTQLHAAEKSFSRDHYLKLLPYTQPIGDLRTNRTIVNDEHASYATSFTKLPPWLEKEVGKFLCHLGLSNDGEFLWNRGVKRQKK